MESQIKYIARLHGWPVQACADIIGFLDFVRKPGIEVVESGKKARAVGMPESLRYLDTLAATCIDGGINRTSGFSCTSYPLFEIKADVDGDVADTVFMSKLIEAVAERHSISVDDAADVTEVLSWKTLGFMHSRIWKAGECFDHPVYPRLCTTVLLSIMSVADGDAAKPEVAKSFVKDLGDNELLLCYLWMSPGEREALKKTVPSLKAGGLAHTAYIIESL